MYRKMILRFLMLLVILGVITGCSSAPAAATQVPVVLEATQGPADPDPTAVPPTEGPVETSPTPVETTFVASKTEDLVGLWKNCCVVGNTLYFKYNSDGTIQIAQDPDLDKIKNTNNSVFYKFWFDGEVFHVQDTNNPSATCGDTEGTYKLTIKQRDGQNSELSFEVINEPCKDRKFDFLKLTSWVSP